MNIVEALHVLKAMDPTMEYASGQIGALAKDVLGVEMVPMIQVMRYFNDFHRLKYVDTRAKPTRARHARDGHYTLWRITPEGVAACMNAPPRSAQRTYSARTCAQCGREYRSNDNDFICSGTCRQLRDAKSKVQPPSASP